MISDTGFETRPYTVSPGLAGQEKAADMLIIPAIDIKDGRCVRLYQGDMEQETVYYQRPLDAARHLLAEGGPE